MPQWDFASGSIGRLGHSLRLTPAFLLRDRKQAAIIQLLSAWASLAKLLGEAQPKGQDRQGGIGLAGCGQDRATCDMQVRQPMHSAFSVDNTVVRAGRHSRCAEMMTIHGS